MTEPDTDPLRPRPRRGVPVWVAAIVGLGAGFVVAEWVGGIVGLAVVLLLSKGR